MANRRLNHRLAKIHRSYTVEEVATLFGVHRNTVREWIRRGLPTCDSKRPQLILGWQLADWVRTRRQGMKRSCQPGELYCVRCRTPQRPAGDVVEYRPLTVTLGTLVGICPSCESLMYRRVNAAKVAQACGSLSLSLPHASPHLDERPNPFVNSDLNHEQTDHDNAQPK
jgi:hypothetical protein